MASRLMYQFMYSLNPMLTYLQGSVAIGSTGAVGTTTGSGIASVTRLAAGQYQITLSQPYARLLGASFSLESPNSGSATDPHSESTGAVYVITTVGDTNWTTAGVPSGVTPAIGVAFKLLAQPATGTGRVKAVGVSGEYGCEIVGNPNTTIGNATNPYFIMQCLGPTVPGASSPNATPAPTDPTDGSTILFEMRLRNSSLKGKGE